MGQAKAVDILLRNQAPSISATTVTSILKNERNVPGGDIEDINRSSIKELNERIDKINLNTDEDAALAFYTVISKGIFKFNAKDKKALQKYYENSDYSSYLACLLQISVNNDNMQSLPPETSGTMDDISDEIKNTNIIRDNGHPNEKKLRAKALDTAKPFADSFCDCLFADDNDECPIYLNDVYQASDIKIPDKVDPVPFSELTDLFSPDSSPYAQKYKHLSGTTGCKRFLITGHPGMGKSTLVQSIAHLYLQGKIFDDFNVFFVSGKSIRNSTGDPVKDLEKIIGVEHYYDHSDIMIILDAYDEISYISQSKDNNSKYAAKLNEAVCDCTLIVTSRPGYVPPYYFYEAEIHGFGEMQCREFLSSYFNLKKVDRNNATTIINECIAAFKNYQNSLKARELVCIPMLLYIIAVKQLHISTYNSRFDMFESLFSYDGHGIMLERGNKEDKIISKSLWDESYRFAKLVAFKMYKLGSTTVTGDIIEQSIRELKLTEYKLALLKNRFAIEVFLRESKNREFTFVHNNIGEYFASKHIMDCIFETIDHYLHDPSFTTKKAKDSICSYFNENMYNPVIMDFIIGDIGIRIPEYSKQEQEQIVSLYTILINESLPIPESKDKEQDKYAYIEKYHNTLVWINNVFNSLFLHFDVEPFSVKNTAPLLYLTKMNDTSSGYDLYFINMSFSSANWMQIDFGKTFFHHCDFTDAHMEYSDFSNSYFGNGCIFDQTKLRQTKFIHSHFMNCVFRGCDLADLPFQNSEFVQTIFENCNMNNTDFTDAQMDKATVESLHKNLATLDHSVSSPVQASVRLK